VNEKNAFLKLLAENEDDITTRLVYADWLDEHGEHEEADRQRKWPAAKEWLVKFCRDNNPDPAANSETRFIPYEDLMNLGWNITSRAKEHTGFASDDEMVSFFCFNNEEMCFALRTRITEFLANWSVVEGISVPANAEEKVHFSCAC
jgi:uncharacterized protein (TIGR02996 family)